MMVLFQQHRSQVCSRSSLPARPSPCCLAASGVITSGGGMFAHTAEARAAQGAHPHRFCGSSLPGHSRVPAPSLRERGKKTVLALSPINTKKGTSSGSQELLPEAHYRELTGFKKRKRRGRSQILWDCLESAESKGKHRPLRRALALGSKQPGSPPCCWCRVACGSPSLLIISKGDFSLESVL